MKRGFDNEFPMEIRNMGTWESLFLGIDIMQLFSIKTSRVERREALAELMGDTKSQAKKILESQFPLQFFREEKPTRKEMCNNLCYPHKEGWVVVPYDVLKESTGIDLGKMKKDQLRGSRRKQK